MSSSSQEIVSSSADNDLFDLLPDEIVLSIFKKLQDAKSLCLSMSVCKRFHSIAPQVDQILLPISPQNREVAVESDHETPKNSFMNLVFKTLMKPLHFISQLIKSKSKNEEDDDDSGLYPISCVPNEVLKSFKEIRELHLRLPCGKNHKFGSKPVGKHYNVENSTTFLKWKAEFGKELHSCVMLGAKSWREKLEKDNNNSGGSGNGSRMMGDEELKLRIVWMISCLIAASARHFLIQEALKLDLKSIEKVVVSDEIDQGRLCMNKQQIQEMLESNKSDGVLEYRTRLPALRMKMWYLEKFEMPDSGKVMEGVTLVVISPAAGAVGVEKGMRGDADLVARAFDEEGLEGKKVLGEVVRRLMVAKKCYTLEMNSF